MSDRLASDRLALRRELRRELWRRGDQASYLLDISGPTGGQQEWVRMLEATPPGGWSALEVSRQRGKTFCVLAWMFGRLGRANMRGVFCAQTGQNADKIASTFLTEIESDLPPEWNVRFVDGEVRFANGSEVAVYGTDNMQFRRSRGRNAHIVVLSEAGFYADLVAVEQVYVPQLQTTGGIGVYESSPAETPAHEFSARCDALALVQRYAHDTFWSNPRIDHEAVIHGEMERLAMTREELLESSAFRREYLAQRIVETTRAALPAWDEAAQREGILELPRPPHFDAYVSFDWGWQPDPSFGIWGWHDVASSRIVVEEECEWRAKTLSEIAADAKAIELRLYGADRFDGTLLGAKDFLERTVPDVWLSKCISDKAPRQPYLRVGDNDVQLLAEMSGPHGYAIMPTDKADKHLQVDNINMLIRQRRLIVHPRCKRLLAQMSGTLWNKARTEWERTSLDHGEGVDCLVYLGRNVRWHRDCRPVPPRDVFVGAQVQSQQSTGLSALASGLTGRRF